VIRHFLSLPVLILLLAGGLLAETAPRPAPRAAAHAVPNLDTIVRQMEQTQLANNNRMVPYTVTREYALYGDNLQQPSSEVIADVSFLPPDQKTYAIKESNGSGRGEKVVKRVLEHEAEITRTGKRIPISSADYDFRYLGEQPLNGVACYLLQLTPKREAKDLLSGILWVDARTYQIYRFEGEPAKNPSWWLKNVKITMNYGQVGDMWLQTSSQGSADVRLLGRHVMTARDIRYQTSSEVAQHLKARQGPRRPSPQAAVGAGIINVQ
jgi:hypothetical protein